MMKLLIVTVMTSAAMAFAPISHGSFRQQQPRTTQLQETFGLGVGEDTYKNQPPLLRGEQEYKQFVNKYKEDNMLNRKVRYMKQLLRFMESPTDYMYSFHFALSR
jgi:DNA replication protein DnaC